MCHRQGGETEGFAKRAIESLVKKLKVREEGKCEIEGFAKRAIESLVKKLKVREEGKCDIEGFAKRVIESLAKKGGGVGIVQVCKQCNRLCMGGSPSPFPTLTNCLLPPCIGGEAR